MYQSLGNLAAAMEKALAENDSQTVERLAIVHDTIMESLENMKDGADSDMKDIIIFAEQKIRKLISTIQIMQTDILNQLSTMNNRRLIRDRYHSKDAR